MKKMFATILVVLAILVGMFAQAEGPDDIRAWSVEEKDGKMTYYVTRICEDGAYRKTEASHSEFEEAVIVLHDRRMEEDRQNEIRNYQADRGSWVKDVLAWCSFWNPND